MMNKRVHGLGLKAERIKVEGERQKRRSWEYVKLCDTEVQDLYEE